MPEPEVSHSRQDYCRPRADKEIKQQIFFEVQIILNLVQD